MGGDMYSCRNS